MTDSVTMRVYRIWFYAGATAAAFLIAMVPLVWRSWPAWLIVLLLQLPAYMIHQVEEYHHDRFRLALNQTLAGGRNLLTPGFALLVNLAGVWMVDLAALYLAYFVRPGLALIAMSLAIVNAIVHLASALIQRAYNPGLLTALLLLLPAGLGGWWVVSQTHRATTSDQILGLGVAIGVHAWIVLHLVRRLKRMEPSATL